LDARTGIYVRREDALLQCCGVIREPTFRIRPLRGAARERGPNIMKKIGTYIVPRREDAARGYSEGESHNNRGRGMIGK